MCMMLQIDVVHVMQLHSVTGGSNCDLEFLPYQQQDRLKTGVASFVIEIMHIVLEL